MPIGLRRRNIAPPR